MNNLELRNKARLIKEALKIVDKLANLNIDEIIEIEELINKSQKLKKDRLWKLN